MILDNFLAKNSIFGYSVTVQALEDNGNSIVLGGLGKRAKNMLGILRFLLALFVVVGHLTTNRAAVSHYGVFAVFGFYVISGYLMTVVLNQTYKFDLPSFALNRFLRLFPIYYVVALISAIVLFAMPSSAEFHPAWIVRLNEIDIAGNLLLMPFAFYDASFRLIPPSWSIGIELTNYFLLWLIVARHYKIAWATVGLASIYFAVTFYLGKDWHARYSPFYAALLPFALGSLLYFHRDYLSSFSAQRVSQVLYAVSAVWMGNLVLCGFQGGLLSRAYDVFYMLNLLLFVVMLACLTHPSQQKQWKRAGKFLGDLSYPIFLTHWLVGFLVFLVIGDRNGYRLMLASLVPILLFSLLLAWMADRLFEPLRNRVRSGIRESKQKEEPRLAAAVER